LKLLRRLHIRTNLESEKARQKGNGTRIVSEINVRVIWRIIRLGAESKQILEINSVAGW
jgi:hypothetical protein